MSEEHEEAALRLVHLSRLAEEEREGEECVARDAAKAAEGREALQGGVLLFGSRCEDVLEASWGERCECGVGAGVAGVLREARLRTRAEEG